MITKRDIIDQAFKLLAMSGYELDDAPEDEQDILQLLDNLMAELQGDDCQFGYNVPEDITQSYLGDDSGIARDALSGIAHKLALRICNLFGKTPPILLVSQAGEAYNTLLTKYMIVPNAHQVADSWQFGSGNLIYGLY